MTRVLPTIIRASAAIGALAGTVVLAGCDLASTGNLMGGNTVILNGASPVAPVVRYRFKCTPSGTTGGGVVEAVSRFQPEKLRAVLTENGFRRSDVVSAQVDSVVVWRFTGGTPSGADLFLGSGASAPLIGSVQFDSKSANVLARDETTRSVTGAIRTGEKTVFAQFDVEDPSSLPAGGGMMEAVVYYRLEVAL